MSVFALKMIASATMLLDHIGYFLNMDVLRCIGRIAFTIYLFLIYNGYKHTSNPLRYALRLAIFAIISQVPYSLCFYRSVWYKTGNVIFTLLASVLCLWCADLFSKDKRLKWASVLPFIGVFCLYHLGVLNSEYGERAMIMMLVLFLFDGKGIVGELLIAAGFAFSLIYQPFLDFAKGLVHGQFDFVFRLGRWQWMQLWALAALPMIFLYTGKKGPAFQSKFTKKAVQYGFYLFYPAHILVLWLIFVL